MFPWTRLRVSYYFKWFHWLPRGSSSLPSGLSPSWKPGMMMKYMATWIRISARNPKMPSLPTTFSGCELYLAMNFSSYTNWHAAITCQQVDIYLNILNANIGKYFYWFSRNLSTNTNDISDDGVASEV